jgi:predicted nucleotidyltransferase
MPAPTVYPELNGVLDELVASVRAILGENLCGAYLQGSFALGDADENSDVDFIVVTHDEVSDTELAGLQAMHRRLYSLESTWAQHLEGSYVAKTELRHVDSSHAPYWYLDNEQPSSSKTTIATRPWSGGRCASTASCSLGRTRTASSIP